MKLYNMLISYAYFLSESVLSACARVHNRTLLVGDLVPWVLSASIYILMDDRILSLGYPGSWGPVC